MGFVESLDSILQSIAESEAGGAALVQRARAEIKFAGKFAELFPDRKADWEKLILKAAKLVKERLSAGGSAADLEAVVAEAEEALSPIGRAAKEYAIHCCGHAHIDMDWMWPWQETVSVTLDTFTTVDRLMDEFPEFHYCQSQASTYAAMEEYCPEMFEAIKKRAKEGRWEPTASMWVEGDKNMASGEILCRHMLHARRYFHERFGLPYDAIKIDWEGDTFGHAHTIPSILVRGGVTRYYHCRTGPGHWLYWWQAPDGSRVLCYNDVLGYAGPLDTWMVDHMVGYVKETGLKDWMFVYGVCDHGGGPTRRDLVRAREMNSWPIFPRLEMSTTDRFFSIVEKAKSDFPVVDNELNYVFEGCYTSQSNIKHANRVSENVLPEIEMISLISGAAGGFPYPADDIRRGWRLAMFNQFHDILPGSGIHATYERAQGAFQEIQAIAGTVRTRALRRLASRVDTSPAVGGVKPAVGPAGETIGDGIGAGAGDPSIPGGVSARNMGAVSAEPVLVFNQLGFPRSEMIMAKVWDKDIPHDKIAIRDDQGDVIAGQVVHAGNYWGHNFITVMFPVRDVPAAGYRVCTIDRADEPISAEGVIMPSSNVMENEFVRVEVDMPSGAIKHLVDKSTGCDLVPPGGLMGVLELYQEAPHGMTAWDIGEIERVTNFDEDGAFEVTQHGPHRCSVLTKRRVGDSRVSVEIGLNAGSPMVDFAVIARWVERGTRETGVPMLRIAFPVNIADPKATYEIPFGSIQRPANGQEVPALRWADLSGDRVGASGSCGITMVNADKYGHNADGNTLRLTLIRSSYDPDRLPEMGNHNIRFAIIPHDGPCSVSAAMRAGAAFNLPMSVVSTDVHKGDLPPSRGFIEVLTPNIMLAAAKKAEDSEAVIVRLYEVEGKATEAKVRLRDIVKPGAPAKEVDLMERPLAKSSAKMAGDILSVKIPAHGIASVMVG